MRNEYDIITTMLKNLINMNIFDFLMNIKTFKTELGDFFVL